MNDQVDNGRSAVDLLSEIAGSLRTRVEQALRAHHVSYDQWRVLQSLASAGPQSMRQLRDSTRVTSPTLTRVVDKLAETALVYRDVDAEDRRRVVVHVSDRGRACYRELQPRLSELEREALAPLSADEAKVFGHLLERLAPAPR